jgi:hypothetical protein
MTTAALEPELIHWYVERSAPSFHDVPLKSCFVAHIWKHHYLNFVTALEVVESNRSARPFG